MPSVFKTLREMNSKTIMSCNHTVPYKNLLRLFQKPGDHPNSGKNALGVKRAFSELSESSGVFSEQLSEFEIPFSEYEIPFSEWPLTTWAIRNPQFSEQLSERFPELPRTRPKDFHLPLHSRSVFSRIGVVPAHQIIFNLRKLFLFLRLF